MAKMKIITVEAQEDYTLNILFTNGELRKYDMKDRLFGIFDVLKDIERFKTVFIDEYGNIAWDRDKNIDSSIHWNNRIDLCNDAVYIDSILIKNSLEKE